MEKFLDSLIGSFSQALPGLAGALVMLLIGWIAATIIKAAVKKGLHLIQLNQKISSQEEESPLDLEGGVSTGLYYVVILFTMLAVFNQLGLEVASVPIQGFLTQVFDFIPKLVGGGVLILIAWFCGRILKQIVSSALSASGLDKKVATQEKPISQSLGEIAYWLVFLVFLPAILGVFQLEGLLAPAQSMIDKITGMIPNIMGAAIIIGVGWFIAKILRDLVTNILAIAGVDKIGEKLGINGKTKLSGVTGMVVYFFTFIPALIAGLSTLNIASIADPATQLLTSVLAFIPNLIGAAAIIGITYLVAKPVASFLVSFLNGIGFDNIPKKLGFKNTSDTMSVSKLCGSIAIFYMLLFATVEAANRLQFTEFSGMVAVLIQLGGQILLGSVIISFGLWLSNVISEGMNKNSKQGSHPVAALIRIIILGLVFSMGLRAMGLANDIVNMAFGLTLGAAAVAFALSFGLGGREAAGRQLDYWFSKMRNEAKLNQNAPQKAEEFIKE